MSRFPVRKLNGRWQVILELEVVEIETEEEAHVIARMRELNDARMSGRSDLAFANELEHAAKVLAKYRFTPLSRRFACSAEDIREEATPCP